MSLVKLCVLILEFILVKLRSGATGLGWAVHPVAGVPIREDPQRHRERQRLELGSQRPRSRQDGAESQEAGKKPRVFSRALRALAS